MPHRLAPVLYPQSVAFVGGSNLVSPLRMQRGLGFAGKTWVVSPKYRQLEGFDCVESVKALPSAPDLAFVAIPREAAIEVIGQLRDIGCRAVVCNAAGFAETGPAGQLLQAELVEAAGDMPMLGPNCVGLANFAVPMAAMMDNYTSPQVDDGIAIVSQGGQLLEDAMMCDRSLRLAHLIGCGNQATTGVEEFVDFLLDDPHVTAVGLSFEALKNVNTLRHAAAKALRVGKPIVALKFGVTAVGARAAASHTAAMAGDGARWAALLDRLGIILTDSISEFFETLKLVDSGQLPEGRRLLVVSGSGLQSVHAADRFSEGGFELPQPTGARYEKLKELLPVMATPNNPQDITAGVWWDLDRSQQIYSTLLEEGYDAIVMVQNHPPVGSEHAIEYSSQAGAVAAACRGQGIPAVQVAPLLDCFPASVREESRAAGLAPMQGLEDCVRALGHAVWWQDRRTELSTDTAIAHAVVTHPPASRARPLNEAAAKTLLARAGVTVPASRLVMPAEAVAAADELGYPVVLKAVDARLLHKTEVGAVRIGLRSAEAVAEAVEDIRSDMSRRAPEIGLTALLVESMVTDTLAELMAAVTRDASVGPVMLLAAGGVEAELWDDKALVAAPFTRDEIERALDRLKVTHKINGWRGRPAADRDALLDMLEAIGRVALEGSVDEVEVNPILVGRSGAVAVDALILRADTP